jgi:hypothetical protein
MNNNADNKDVLPRGRMGHETSRENRIDDDVSNNDYYDKRQRILKPTTGVTTG